MNIIPFLSGVTQTITNQTAPRSIPAVTVGNAFRDLAQITKTNIEPIELVLSRVEVNNLFIGSEIQANLIPFLLDLKLNGVTVSPTDKVHIYTIYRNFNDSSGVKWIFSIGINGAVLTNRTCGVVINAPYTEPVPDASGRRIDTLTLSSLNGSNATGTAVVDWSAIPDNIGYNFLNSNDWNKALLSPNVYNPKVSAFTNLTTSLVKRGTSTVENELQRLDNNNLFKGSEIQGQLLEFLLDLNLSGLIINTADRVHIHYAWRGFINSGIPTWVIAIGINGTRVATATFQNYVEPVPDASGRRIATVPLNSVGSLPNNTSVTGTAVVDWSKLVSGIGNIYDNEVNIPKALLSPNVYNPKIPIAIPIPSAIARIEKNNIFSGDTVDASLLNFLLDVKFTGTISVPSNSVLHVYWVYRDFTQSVGVQRWVVAFAIYNNGGTGDRICQFLRDNVAEPTPDANGRRIETLKCTSINGTSTTAEITVDWNALPTGVSFFNTSLPNSKKGALSPNRYLNQLGGSTSAIVKTNLPSTAVPNRIYTVLNDIDNRNYFTSAGALRQDLARSYSLSLYVDRFLKGFAFDTDVRFDLTGTDKYRLTSPRKGDDDIIGFDHPPISTGITKTLTINGGTNYNNRIVSLTHISTRESVGSDKAVGFLPIGDSTIEGLNVEIGVPEGYAHKAWGVVHEQFMKSQIDYLLATGYTASQIMSGSISPSDANKFKFTGMGTSPNGSGGNDIYTLNYRGVTKTYTVKADGRGGWGFREYINKPILCQRQQGTWDILGLGNGTGTDFTGTPAQNLLFDKTAWNPSAIINTVPMRAWVSTNYGFSGSTTTDYINWAEARATTPANFFFDKDKTDTVTDANGNVWQIRFSIKKYLERYRTMDNSGNRLVLSASTVGTKVSSTSDYDIYLPTHILLQSCQNDGNIAHFGLLANSLAQSIKAEYTANGYGSVNIGFSIIDGAGTYFPKLYPEVDAYCKMNESQRGVHDDNLTRLLTTVTDEDSNKIWVISNTHVSPTAKSVIYRNGNSPEFDLTMDIRDSYSVASRTSLGIHAHQNAVGHRVWGIQNYAWIKYTLGL